MTAFLAAFAFSFIGSIPPGAINISVIQLSMEDKFRSAIQFSLAAALIEFPYSFIAVAFSDWLLSTEGIFQNIKLVSALLMLGLGLINLVSFSQKDKAIEKRKLSSFKDGLIVSILNPLAIPFWIGITAYLIKMEWIKLDTLYSKLLYSVGVSMGTFVLLLCLIALTNRFNIKFKNQQLAKLIPAIIFFLLGFYGLFEALF